jgi:malonate transporter and related proteins
LLAGLIIAAYDIKLSAEIITNTLIKMVAQPLLMALLVTALDIADPLRSEGIVICAIPTAVFAPLLAPRYRIYEVESSSTLVAAAVLMIVPLPLTIILASGSIDWTRRIWSCSWHARSVGRKHLELVMSA